MRNVSAVVIVSFFLNACFSAFPFVVWRKVRIFALFFALSLLYNQAIDYRRRNLLTFTSAKIQTRFVYTKNTDENLCTSFVF